MHWDPNKFCFSTLYDFARLVFRSCLIWWVRNVKHCVLCRVGCSSWGQFLWGGGRWRRKRGRRNEKIGWWVGGGGLSAFQPMSTLAHVDLASGSSFSSSTSGNPLQPRTRFVHPLRDSPPPPLQNYRNLILLFITTSKIKHFFFLDPKIREFCWSGKSQEFWKKLQKLGNFCKRSTQ